MSMTEQQKKLVEDNHNLIYSFLHQYNLPIEEYYDLAAIGLCKAAILYDANKACFSTYAYRSMWTHVFTEERKKIAAIRIPENQIVYYQAEMDDSENRATSYINYISANENVEDEVLSDIVINEYMSKLKDEHKKIIILLKNGYTQREISQMVGYSQAQISRVKKEFNRLSDAVKIL